METTKTKIEYHLLNNNENSPWQPLGNVDELIWDGVYAIRTIDNEGICGLPFSMSSDDMVNIVVKDYVPDDNVQINRIILQTLTRVERVSGSVYTYTRTRRYKNGEHIWGEWNCQNQESTGSALLADGIVTAEKLADDIRNKVENPLRPLFIAAGAEYNDTGADKTKTAPWGENVTHKAGHYYLNGLGDITEEQMMHIYNYKDAIKYLPKREGYRNTLVRTYFTPCEMSGQKESQYTHSAFVNNLNLETVIWTTLDTDINTRSTSYMYNSQGSHFMFSGCKKLKIVYPMNVKSAAIMEVSNFNDCSSLVEVRLFNLMLNTGFKDSPNISKQSILYIVNNAAPTSAITITLHADAYGRLADDAEILAALEAQPLVSLVSA